MVVVIMYFPYRWCSRCHSDTFTR